jgi:hypothetical protein
MINKLKFFTVLKNRVEFMLQANQIVAFKVNSYQDTLEITSGIPSTSFRDYRYSAERSVFSKILSLFFRGPLVWFYRKYEANQIFRKLAQRRKWWERHIMLF